LALLLVIATLEHNSLIRKGEQHVHQL